MIFYAAGQFEIMQDPAKEEALARDILSRYSVYGRLISFFFASIITSALKLKAIFSNKVRIMLDSGAFSAWKAGGSIDIDDYIGFIEENGAAIDHYINLDVIPDGEASYKNFQYMKRRGLNPIPVFHTCTPAKYLVAYLKESAYIALSVVDRRHVAKQITQLDYFWDRYLTDDQGYALVKVHGLGVSSLRIIDRYPWHSVDNGAWAQASSRRSLLIPKAGNDSMALQHFSISRKKIDGKNHYSNLDPDEQKKISDYLTVKRLELGL